MLSNNYAVVDLSAHRPIMQEPIIIQKSAEHPPRPCRSTYRTTSRQQAKLSKSASGANQRVVNNHSPGLPPLMMRSRSSSVTSSEMSPSLSTISNSSSLRRNNSAESRTMIPAPRAPLPPLLPPRLPEQHQQQQQQQQSRPPSVATMLAGIPRPPTALSCTDTMQSNNTSLRESWKSMVSSTSLAMSPKKRKQQMQDEWGYILSQDHAEQDRLVAQHYLLRMIFGGDTCAPGISSMLEKPSAVVLDIGCGPGAWTMEMAYMYPKATFIGIDQDKFFPQDIKPKNCHFRQYDIAHGLPFPDNSVDYIYQRDMNCGLSTELWRVSMQEYMRVLKPGGWVELVEPDLETQSSLPNECSMNDKILEGMLLRQQNPYMARHLSTLLASNGFRRIQSQFQSLPLGWDPVDESQEEKADDNGNDKTSKKPEEKPKKCSELARLAASQHLFLLQSLRPWLSLVMHLNTDKFNNHIMGLPESWRLGQTYINWHCATAQKPIQSV